MTTNRNLEKEFLYSHYIDREYGEDTETIDYPRLIRVMTEILSRVEQLEKVNKEKLALLNVVENKLND